MSSNPVAVKSTADSIDDLQNELLRLIIVSAAVIDPHTGSDIGWIRITHVCSRWRELALNTRSLWTNIILNLGEDWTKAMIQRAGPTTLLSVTAVDCRFWNDNLYEAFGLIPPEMHRVVRLDLWGDFEEMGSICSALEDAPAPALRYLRLAKSENQSGDSDSVIEGIFKSQTPLLEHLCLDGVPFPSTSFYLFNHLKHLYVYSAGNDSGVFPSPSELLSVLACTPELESLSLLGCILWDNFNNTSALGEEQNALIRLPKLRTLNLEGHKDVLDYMAGHIVYPDVASLSRKKTFSFVPLT
ncbi:hypothetical protein K435DRAFT_969101 [Dendrothele bispora CBS 962.96]|uniref:Uncharacterized protein n=1 Tax=Dendrothele bispora (strain CBS 962.96) TaxID=1314807 RepID=A0A4S8LKL0_DENBC|nr:hypothetical protein K435DRAFT_969101 [Dendrothele bispora CBS 962.96]